MARDSKVSEKVKLFIGVLALQCCYAGFHIVSRAALNMGVSKIVFTVYRNVIALALLCPFAYFLEKKDRPPLTFSLLIQFFLLALCGIFANQGFYLLGLYYLSPTYASAIQNSVPAITFAMAAALRLEQVNFKRRDGLAKIVGTVGSIAGATILTLYKGPPLFDPEAHGGLEGAMITASSSSIIDAGRNVGKKLPHQIEAPNDTRLPSSDSVLAANDSTSNTELRNDSYTPHKPFCDSTGILNSSHDSYYSNNSRHDSFPSQRLNLESSYDSTPSLSRSSRQQTTTHLPPINRPPLSRVVLSSVQSNSPNQKRNQKKDLPVEIHYLNRHHLSC